jgi:hypothetical protein
MSEKEPRCEITAAQIDMAIAVLTYFLPHGADGIGTHPDELAEAGIAAQAASNLFRRAAEVHQGLVVSWKQMCDAAFLPAAANQLKASQDVLEPLLRQLGVELVRQDSWRKGAALPGFRVNGAGQKRAPGCCDGCGNTDPRLPQPCPYRPERGSQGNWICMGWRPQEEVDAMLVTEEKQPTAASEPEDLTLLDDEPENRSECDRCTAEINTDNEGVMVDGSLLCAKCHADDQLPRCCACGETGELSPDAGGDLVCKDCLGADEIGRAAENITLCVKCSAVVDLSLADSGEDVPGAGVMCAQCLNDEDGEPEICSGCGKRFPACGHLPVVDNCEGFSG